MLYVLHISHQGVGSKDNHYIFFASRIPYNVAGRTRELKIDTGIKNI